MLWGARLRPAFVGDYILGLALPLPHLASLPASQVSPESLLSMNPQTLLLGNLEYLQALFFGGTVV
jgi:hypothetical protein